MAPTFNAMETLGWQVIDVPEGHDLQSVYRAIEQAIATARGNDHQPVLVRVRTVKGYGVKATEKNASGGHGFPLKGGEKIVEFVSEICGGEVPEALMNWAQELRSQWEAQEAAKAAAKGTSPSVKKDKIQRGLLRRHSGAQKASVLAKMSRIDRYCFSSAFRRFVEGIAESNMVCWPLCQNSLFRSLILSGNLRDQGKPPSHYGSSFASSCDCHLFPCWISGCRGWCEPSGNHLFCGHQLHPSHGGHCAFLLR